MAGNIPTERRKCGSSASAVRVASALALLDRSRQVESLINVSLRPEPHLVIWDYARVGTPLSGGVVLQMIGKILYECKCVKIPSYPSTMALLECPRMLPLAG
jgi:hypothetical protein